eukprot:1553851-Pleurochrysis_carterae.AAC.3
MDLEIGTAACLMSVRPTHDALVLDHSHLKRRCGNARPSPEQNAHFPSTSSPSLSPNPLCGLPTLPQSPPLTHALSLTLPHSRSLTHALSFTPSRSRVAVRLRSAPCQVIWRRQSLRTEAAAQAELAR